MTTIQTRKGKRGTTYRIEMMRDGRRISKSFKIKKEAQLFAAQLLVDDDFAHSLTNKTLNTFKFDEAVREYIKQDTGKDLSKHQRLNYWSVTFKSKPVGKITRQMVRTELRKLAEVKAPATVNRYKAALGAFYKHLANEFDVDHNPTKGIPQLAEDNARTRFLSDTELPLLLSKAKDSQWDRLYLLVLMAITTGARRSELLKLNWSDIDLKKRTAHLGETKNGSQRILTLTGDVIEELLKFRQGRGFVFPHPQSDHVYFKNFDCHWKELLLKCGITNFRFHDLRHSCASLLAMNGASLLEIAEVLGHKSITMTQRYSHLCTDHKASLTDRVFGGINQRQVM